MLVVWFLRSPFSWRLLAGVAALAAIVFLPAGCAGSAPGSRSGRLEVVAAEDVWGTVARELGGARVHVTSIIATPNADPHSYEPTPTDARALATARLAIVNGVGYDPWASRLLAASPAADRRTLDVGRLVGAAPSTNPHLWYSPAYVERVVAALAVEYQRLDPREAVYFRRRQAAVEASLARYRRLVARIRTRYAGVAVGVSESVVAPLAAALGLRLLTPPAFFKAVSEGTEPTASARGEAERQIDRRAIRVWIVNRQNSTPDVAHLTARARSLGIPVIAVTETLSPAGARFEAWQSGQLVGLQGGLSRATGR